jgi:hypothetical protein
LFLFNLSTDYAPHVKRGREGRTPCRYDY